MGMRPTLPSVQADTQGSGLGYKLAPRSLVARVQADTANKLSSAMVETFAKSPFGQTAEKGAIALEYACTSPDMDGEAAPPSADDCKVKALGLSQLKGLGMSALKLDLTPTACLPAQAGPGRLGQRAG